MGGAGATHGCEIADAIGMHRVLVPPSPGLASAFGALAAQVRVDAVRSVHLVDTTTRADDVDHRFAELEARAEADFAAQAGGRTPSERRRIAALRYQGQNYEQEVPVPAGTLTDGALRRVYDEFARLYEGFYGYRLDGIPIELVRLQVVVTGEPPRVSTEPKGASPQPAGETQRQVWFGAFVATPVLRRETIAPGASRAGPLVIEEMDSTVVVPPSWHLAVLPDGTLEMTRT
jgi:N-methylhydantoinase A